MFTRLVVEMAPCEPVGSGGCSGAGVDRSVGKRQGPVSSEYEVGDRIDAVQPDARNFVAAFDQRPDMDQLDQFHVTCPYCGEAVEITVEEDVGGGFVQDCEVCCNPWLVRVTRSGDGRDISVVRADGSE